MLRRLAVDAGAGAVRAGEREAADERARGERLAHGGAGAGDEVEDAGRQAGVLQALDELERRQRRGRRRLEDDGVAVGERRRDLPGRDGDGEVPRRDDGDHAERLAPAEQHRLGRVGRQHFAGAAPALAGEVAQDVARPRDLAPGLRDRLALLARERGGDVLEALVEQLGGPEQDRAAGRRRRGGPAPGTPRPPPRRRAPRRRAVALGNVASTTSLCAGSRVSKLPWSDAPTHSPPIRSLQMSMSSTSSRALAASVALTILRPPAERGRRGPSPSARHAAWPTGAPRRMRAPAIRSGAGQRHQRPVREPKRLAVAGLPRHRDGLVPEPPDVLGARGRPS